MHPIEQRQLASGVGAERLQGAPGIADRLPVQPVAHAVGDPALEALPARVPAVHPIAHDRRSTAPLRSEEHTSELQSHSDLVCRLLLAKKRSTRKADSSNMTC